MLDFWEAYERGIQKISWGTSQFVDWAACAVLNRSKMVLSGDVPSNCSLASFRHARFFDFFNEIGACRPLGRVPVIPAAGAGEPEDIGASKSVRPKPTACCWRTLAPVDLVHRQSRPMSAPAHEVR